jgi:hypothetical protein
MDDPGCRQGVTLSERGADEASIAPRQDRHHVRRPARDLPAFVGGKGTADERRAALRAAYLAMNGTAPAP